jgi:hypothetical protein
MSSLNVVLHEPSLAVFTRNELGWKEMKKSVYHLRNCQSRASAQLQKQNVIHSNSVFTGIVEGE